MQKHRLISIILRLSFVCCSWVVSPVSATATSEDLEWLGDESLAPGELLPVVVFLENEELTKQVEGVAAAPNLTRAARIKTVSHRLKSFIPSRAAAIESFLNHNSTAPVTRYWIVPAFSATLDRSQVLVLAAMPGVKKIVPDVAVDFVEPVETRAASSLATSSSSHARMMNVQYLWQIGLNGTGRLVCSFDTGVEQSHPALAANWRGNRASLSASWFSTVTPNAPPSDKADHGTHTMGIMVGVDGSDTIGIAPGAEWITAGVVDQGKSLPATFSDILAAYQWVLNPDGDPQTTDDVPDVILNSWGVPATLFSPCDNTFFAAIDNVEAAGIVCIFAAGNEGPDASTLRNPASRATSPLNAFSVGAVDNGKAVADFSSRGPGGCGMTAVKPEIVAPGVSVRSAAKDGGYKLMTGTSMAAPMIAGLVALCRQYNPNAAVDEIKWAIINSADDLGVQGEDNAYGFGLPDASKLLDYLSDPEMPHFRLAGYSVSDDGVASPGKTFELQITLARTTGSVQSVAGVVVPGEPSGITMIRDSADFNFGLSGTTSLGSQAYQISFDHSLVNGEEAHFALSVRGIGNQVFDSLTFSVPIGVAPNGIMAAHNSGSIEVTVSDFGQYGLAAGSIYNVGGRGFRYHGGDNLLYEAGFMVGRNQLQLSSSIRDENGVFTPSDFVAEESLSEAWTGPDLAVHRSARLVDDFSEISIPVGISQLTSDYGQAGAGDVILIRFQLVNTALSTLNDLYFGFLSDFDLPGGYENITYENSLDLACLSGDSGPMVGIVALAGLSSLQAIANQPGKTGFSRAQQYELISSGGEPDENITGDLLTIVSGGPYLIAPGDSVEVALALVAGNDLNELYAAAIEARELYLSPTGVGYPIGGLPENYRLHQNYPNPFNPSTTISFELPVAAEVSLRIFNLLGQQVRQLHSGWLPAGEHQVVWDSRADDGREVASGVYFYRLTTNGWSHSRKMVLLR